LHIRFQSGSVHKVLNDLLSILLFAHHKFCAAPAAKRVSSELRERTAHSSHIRRAVSLTEKMDDPVPPLECLIREFALPRRELVFLDGL